MNRGIKIAATGSAIVAAIVVSTAVSSVAFAPPGNISAPSISGFSVTPNHAGQNITASWNEASPGDSFWGGITGYKLWWYPAGNPSGNTLVELSGKTTTSWTHSDPVLGKTYSYQVAPIPGNGWGIAPTSAISATVYALPTVSSGTFDESTNIVTLTASQSIKAAKAANVCVHNTLGFNGTNGMTYEPFDRCGSSASVSGTTVTVTISGEYSVNATMTSESIGIGVNAIQNTHDLWNAVVQEIVLTGGQ